MAASRGKRSALDRALFHMRPDRVAARFISGGRHQSFAAIARSPFKTKTVHTPKSGRRAYQQRVARERKAAVAAVRAARKQGAEEQRAARAWARQQPRPPRPRRPPIAVNPRTGKPITWRQAQAAMRAAEREVQRIERELAGGGGKAPRKRATKAVPPVSKSPLQRAIEDARKSKRPAAKKAAKKATPTRRVSGRKVAPIPPVPAGTVPQPLQPPGLDLRGVAMAAACACHGTGRVPVYGPDNALAGTVSCPTHGRGRRGIKKFTARRSLIQAGLPGIAGWLERKNRRGARTPDRKQERAAGQAAKRPRNTGPITACGQCERGVVNRGLTDRLRDAWVADELAKIDGEVKRGKARRRFDREAQSRYPHDLCRVCKGLGVVPMPADAGWFEAAGLRKGHRPTARERATGRARTENAARVERRRKLPRL